MSATNTTQTTPTQAINTLGSAPAQAQPQQAATTGSLWAQHGGKQPDAETAYRALTGGGACIPG